MGNYANTGLQWLPAKRPRRVQGHDFPGPEAPAPNAKFSDFQIIS